jgi:hypothetical protein
MICLQIPTVFWTGGRITSVRYIQQTDRKAYRWAISTLLHFFWCWLKVQFESWKGTHHQVLIKFLQNWYKQEVVLKSSEIYTHGTVKNCHSSGKNLLLYLFMKRVIKLTTVIIGWYPTTCSILSSILVSWLPPYIEEITVDHQCGFQHNRSTTGQLFYIREILD